MIKIGVKSAENPWIFMGYVTNFLARGDSILLTLFLVLWSNQVPIISIILFIIATGQLNYNFTKKSSNLKFLFFINFRMRND